MCSTIGAASRTLTVIQPSLRMFIVSEARRICMVPPGQNAAMIANTNVRALA
jgi:hypothetical protein